MKSDDIEKCCECDCEIPHNEINWAEGDKPFCNDCINDLEECAYCGDMRFTENLVEYNDKTSKWHRKRMCVGCIEEAMDEEEKEKGGE